MDATAQWDRYLDLEQRMHEATDPAAREDLRRAKLDMEIQATRRAYEARPAPRLGQN